MNGHVTRKAAGGLDYYPTPPHATFALVDMEKRWIDRHLPTHQCAVWEPAAGRGWMSEELMRLGYPVVSSDVCVYPDPRVPVTQHDFLVASPLVERPGAIVTNPPYGRGLAQAFAERAISLAPYVAMLCRATWVESQERYAFFTRNRPSRILFFSKRISCSEELFGTGRENGGMVAYAWFVWDRCRDGEAAVDWINPDIYERWKESVGAKAY